MVRTSEKYINYLMLNKNHTIPISMSQIKIIQSNNSSITSVNKTHLHGNSSLKHQFLHKNNAPLQQGLKSQMLLDCKISRLLQLSNNIS